MWLSWLFVGFLLAFWSWLFGFLFTTYGNEAWRCLGCDYVHWNSPDFIGFLTRL